MEKNEILNRIEENRQILKDAIDSDDYGPLLAIDRLNTDMIIVSIYLTADYYDDKVGHELYKDYFELHRMLYPYLMKEFNQRPRDLEHLSFVYAKKLDSSYESWKLEEILKENYDGPEAIGNYKFLICAVLKMIISVLAQFCPERSFKNTIPDLASIRSKTEEEAKIDVSLVHKNDLRSKAPSNGQRVLALQEFCPDIVRTLQGQTREIQGQTVYLITGVNKEDAYKLLFSEARRELKSVDNSSILEVKRALNI